MTGRRMLGWMGLAIMAFLASCTAVQYQADRLDEHIDRATREEIAVLFGQPRETRALEGGGEEWMYRYLYTTAGGTAAVGRRTCWENVLIFDEHGILRDRQRREC